MLRYIFVFVERATFLGRFCMTVWYNPVLPR